MSYTCNPAYQKSALTAYTTIDQTVAVDAPIVYDNIDVLTGCSVKYVAGTPAVVLAKPGMYLVAVDTDVTAAPAAATTAAAGTDAKAAAPEGENVAAISLQNNGVEIPGAVAKTVVQEGAVSDLAFTTLVKVRPSCCAVDNTARLEVINTGIAAVHSDAHITVVKIA